MKQRKIRISRFVGGLLLGVLGVYGFFLLATVSSVRESFEGQGLHFVWFVVPIFIAVAGPAFFWIYLPYTDRTRGRRP